MIAPKPLAHVDALVLDLDTRAGLCITRSLGRAGCVVAIAARDAAAPGRRTRYAASSIVVPSPEADFDAHARALLAALEVQRADTTIPTIDASLETLHRYRDEFGRVTAPAVASADALEITLSKERTLAVARELGIPVPRSIVVSGLAALDDAIAEIGTPCVLKPITSWRPLGAGGERVGPMYAADLASARRLVSALAPAGSLLVQELADGPRETIKLFRHRGQTLARLAMTVDRAWPPLGGSSVMRHTTAIPADTVEHAERLIAEVGLEGYGEVEFRRDRRGRPLLMEINARISQSIELACHAGVDFPRMQLEWARGGRIPRAPSATVGLRVGWLAGDLRLVVGAVFGCPPPRPRIGATVRSIVGDYVVHRARLEGFDLRDPRPMIGSVGLAFRALAGRHSVA